MHKHDADAIAKMAKKLGISIKVEQGYLMASHSEEALVVVRFEGVEAVMVVLANVHPRNLKETAFNYHHDGGHVVIY